MTTRPLDSRKSFRLPGARTARSAGRVDQFGCARARREVPRVVSGAFRVIRAVQEPGLPPFHSVMTRGYRPITPVICKQGGMIASQIADILHVRLPAPEAVVRPAVDCRRTLKRDNHGRHDHGVAIDGHPHDLDRIPD